MFLTKKGYVVLGRNLLMFSLGSSAGMLFLPMIKQTVWKENVEKRRESNFVPTGTFNIRLEGTKYSKSIFPDEVGNLKINILDFAPYYKEGTPFYLTLLSPENEILNEFVINTEEIASFLLKPKFPPILSFSVFFDDSTGDKDLLLDGEEKGRIVLLVKNTGKDIARNLEIRLTPLRPIPHLNIPQTQKIDIIGVNEEKRVIIPISADREVPTTQVELKVEILEPYFQADAEPQILRFETRKFEPPNLVVYDKGVEEGEIVAGKSANISLIIQNQGKGKAEAVRCEIRVPQGITYLGESPIFNFGSLEPSEWQRIDFPIFIGARYQEESLKIYLSLKERRQEFSKDIIVSFPLNRPIQRPKEIVIKGKEKIISTTPPPVLTADVDINIPESKVKNPNGIAVIIANKEYEDPRVPNVDYADNDGRIMKEYLIKALGYEKENIIFLLNAKKSDFERIFGTEKDYKGMLYNYLIPQKSDVFIYYTGHGAPDVETKSGYFVPVDCHPDFVRFNGYALETFYKNLLSLPARSVTVVIDACFSGASEKGMLIAKASPLLGVVLTPAISGKLNVFTSCGEDEISSWYPEKNHSLFTYFFLKGLQGEADLNKNNEITLGELKEYLSEKVSYWARRLFNRKQNPIFKGDKNMVITILKK